MKKVLVSSLAFFAIFMPYLELQFPASATAQAVSSRDPAIRGFVEQDSLPSPNEIFSLVNSERQTQGLEVLKPSHILMEVAQARAADMQRNKYYDHQSPEGSYYYDMLSSSDYGDTYSCENLDLRFDTVPQRYVKDWLDSPAHKKCLLSSTSTRAGYAVIKIAPTDKSQDVPAYIVVAIHAAE